MLCRPSGTWGMVLPVSRIVDLSVSASWPAPHGQWTWRSSTDSSYLTSQNADVGTSAVRVLESGGRRHFRAARIFVPLLIKLDRLGCFSDDIVETRVVAQLIPKRIEL